MKWMFIGLCIVVVGLAVYLVLTQFGGGSKAVMADENVVAGLPDGEAREMASSKSEAFRGSVSTEAYFEMLGSLVSDSLRKGRLPVEPTMTERGSAVEKGSAVERVFGAQASDGDARPEPGMTEGGRRSGGGSASRSLSTEERGSSAKFRV